MTFQVRLILLLSACLIVTGCGTMIDNAVRQVETDKERERLDRDADALLRARKVGRGYQPIDPITVPTQAARTNQLLLKELPNEAMRLAVGQLDASGNVSFGPATIAVKDSTYLVILDYIKYRSRSMLMRYKLRDPMDCEQRSEKLSPDKRLDFVRIGCAYDYEALSIERSADESKAGATEEKRPGSRSEIQTLGNWQYTYIPLYMGVGVRMIASVTVQEGKVNLSSPIGLGAAAQANQISGGLLVQTLGASGEAISPVIPIPSELNVTTIQNAIMALGTVKSKLYDSQNVTLSAQIVGVDDFVATQASKDAIVSGVYRFLNDLRF
jgi:hypothetical protein